MWTSTPSLTAHDPKRSGLKFDPFSQWSESPVQVNLESIPLLLNLPPTTATAFLLTRLVCWWGEPTIGIFSIVYCIAKRPSRGFWMLTYLPPFVPKSSFPSKISSSSSKLRVLPIPANLGMVAIASEHSWKPEKTSTSPPFVIIKAAAGWQTNVDGLNGSEEGCHYWSSKVFFFLHPLLIIDTMVDGDHIYACARALCPYMQKRLKTRWL